MAKNKIITSQGNVQFINSKGRTINVHPWHVYSVYEGDTVSFLFVYMKDYSGQAIFASQYEDLEVNGETYDNMDDLKNALSYAFAKAGAQARTEIVTELPEDPFTNTIYLLPKEHGEGFDEYIWNEDEGWQLIGDTDVEWERYLKIADFNEYSAATAEEIAYISGAVDTNAADIVALSGAIDTEITAREAADTYISGAVDTVSADLATESQRAVSAETALGNRIDSANARIDAEQTARALADTFISGAVDTEVSNRISADTALQTAIDNEASARTDADSALSDKIDYVSGAVDTVSSDLSSEVSRAQGAESALNTKVNALSGAIDSVDDKVDALSGEVQTMGDEAVVDAEYVSSSTTIDFYNASGDVVAQVDATDFIKDGMIEDVRIENGYLIIDFNTESGIQDIQIPLTDIFNPANYYDKDAIDGIVSGINDSIADEVSARTDADAALQSAINTVSGSIPTTYISDVVEGHAASRVYLGKKMNGSNTITWMMGWGDINGTPIAALGQRFNNFSLVETSAFTTYSAATETALNNKLDTSAFETYSGNVDSRLGEDEEVWGAALNQLNSDLSGETSARTSADAALQSAIDTVSGNVETETSRAESAETALQTAIDNEISARTAAIEAIEGEISGISDSLSAYSTTVEMNAAIDAAVSGKQDTLIAGENITISGNVISAEGGGKAISAGTNISVTTGETADTVSCTLPLTVGSSNSSLSLGIGNNLNSSNRTIAIGDNNSIANLSANSLVGGMRSSINYNCSNSIAYGYQANVGAAYSYSIGSETKTSNNYETAFGRYNASNTGSTDADKTRFSVGNGTDDNARHNAFEIRQNGDIYIVSGGTDIKLQDNLGSTVEVSSAITSGDTNAVAGGAVYDKFDEVEQVTARALVDLNDKLGGLKLQKITQSAYDALVQGGTTDANTLYIISD